MSSYLLYFVWFILLFLCALIIRITKKLLSVSFCNFKSVPSIQNFLLRFPGKCLYCQRYRKISFVFLWHPLYPVIELMRLNFKISTQRLAQLCSAAMLSYIQLSTYVLKFFHAIKVLANSFFKHSWCWKFYAVNDRDDGFHARLILYSAHKILRRKSPFIDQRFKGLYELLQNSDFIFRIMLIILLLNKS